MVGHLLPEKQRCLVDCPTQPSPSITISIHQHHLFLFNFYLHVYNWIYSAISFIQHCICHTQPSQSITISVHQHHLFLFNFLQCVFIQHFTTAKFLSSSFEWYPFLFIKNSSHISVAGLCNFLLFEIPSINIYITNSKAAEASRMPFLTAKVSAVSTMSIAIRWQFGTYVDHLKNLSTVIIPHS